jgi:flagellar hook-length control protein FliK
VEAPKVEAVEPAAPAPVAARAATAAPAPEPQVAARAATAAPEAAPKVEAPVQPLVATPAAPATPVAPPVVTQRTAPLHHVPRVTATLIHVASERGITRARINLRPEDLGGIEVRLQTGPAGVSAHLVADSPEAARLLTQAGDDLRRSLEARDVNLLSLEVSTSGEERRGAQPGEDLDFDTWRGPADAADGEAAPAEPVATTQTLELPGGLLVDVLA